MTAALTGFACEATAMVEGVIIAEDERFTVMTAPLVGAAEFKEAEHVLEASRSCVAGGHFCVLAGSAAKACEDPARRSMNRQARPAAVCRIECRLWFVRALRCEDAARFALLPV